MFRVIDIMAKKVGCPVGYIKAKGHCVAKKKFYSRGTHDVGEMFVHPVGNHKYVAFYLSFGEKPKVTGLTVPLTSKQLKETFNINIGKK